MLLGNISRYFFASLFSVAWGIDAWHRFREGMSVEVDSLEAGFFLLAAIYDQGLPIPSGWTILNRFELVHLIRQWDIPEHYGGYIRDVERLKFIAFIPVHKKSETTRALFCRYSILSKR